MFSLIFGGGKLFLRIAGKIAKIVKIRTRNNFVPHGISGLSELFFCFADSLSLYSKKTIKKSRPVRRRKASAHLKFSLIACKAIEL